MTGPHRSVVVRVLTVFALITSIWIADARSAQAQTRIMPPGDSITGSPECWRALLWNDIQDAGFTCIDLVGTLPPQGCAIPYDGDNEGHGGILATDVANQNLDVILAASGSGTLQPTSGDTYAVTYTAGGVSFTVSEHF
jgi:hypothetical protein